MDRREAQKQAVAKKLITDLVDHEQIKKDSIIGLGTGSTVQYAVQFLAEAIKTHAMHSLSVVVTSYQTALLCESYGITVLPLYSNKLTEKLSLCIDGADQCTKEKVLIKGGGAALLREKIVAYNSHHFYVIADSSKLVDTLTFPLPVEVLPDAYQLIINQLKPAITGSLRFGINKQGPIVTDNGNFILDLHCSKDTDYQALAEKLNRLPGVLEHGIFTHPHLSLYISHDDMHVCIY